MPCKTLTLFDTAKHLTFNAPKQLQLIDSIGQKELNQTESRASNSLLSRGKHTFGFNADTERPSGSLLDCLVLLVEATEGATRGGIGGKLERATDGAIERATDGAIERATDGATERATDGAAEWDTERATDGAADGTAEGATEARRPGLSEVFVPVLV